METAKKGYRQAKALTPKGNRNWPAVGGYSEFSTSALTRCAAAFSEARARGINPRDAMGVVFATLRAAGAYLVLPKKLQSRGVPPYVEALINGVAQFHGLTLADLRTTGRRRLRNRNRCAAVRGEATYLARTLCAEVSYRDLGKYFGGRHHATILATREAFAQRMKTDETLRSRISRVVGAMAAADGVAVKEPTPSPAACVANASVPDDLKEIYALMVSSQRKGPQRARRPPHH